MTQIGLDDIKLFKNKFLDEATVDNYLNEPKVHLTKDDWAQLLYTCLQANKLTDAVKSLKQTRYSVLYCTVNAQPDTIEIGVNAFKQLFPDPDSPLEDVPFEKGLTAICANGAVFMTKGLVEHTNGTFVEVEYIATFQGPQGIQGVQGETGPQGIPGPEFCICDIGAHYEHNCIDKTNKIWEVTYGPDNAQFWSRYPKLGERILLPAAFPGDGLVPPQPHSRLVFTDVVEVPEYVSADTTHTIKLKAYDTGWLITGPRGIQGIQGIQGETGEQGPGGASIARIEHVNTTDDGSYHRIYLDNGLTAGSLFVPRGLQGIQGVQGIRGETGEQGDPGKDICMCSHPDVTWDSTETLWKIPYSSDSDYWSGTPQINGHVYFTTYSTGNYDAARDGYYLQVARVVAISDNTVSLDPINSIRMSGEQGPQGIQGEQGAQGETGPRGYGIKRSYHRATIQPSDWAIRTDIAPFLYRCEHTGIPYTDYTTLENATLTLDSDERLLTRYGIIIGTASPSSGTLTATLYALRKPTETLYNTIILEELTDDYS